MVGWLWLTMYASLGVLLAVCGVPMWLRKVPPNRVYGFRTPRTLSDREVWYEANAIAGRALFYGGLLTMVFGLVDYALGLPFLVAAFLPLVPVVASVLWSFWGASVFLARLDGHLEGEEVGERGGLARQEPVEGEDRRRAADAEVERS